MTRRSFFAALLAPLVAFRFWPRRQVVHETTWHLTGESARLHPRVWQPVPWRPAAPIKGEWHTITLQSGGNCRVVWSEVMSPFHVEQ